ncbi:MAG: hypothetical protein ACRETN_02605 [Nevskiales bacterium]
MKRIVRDMRKACLAALQSAVLALVVALAVQGCNDATKRPAGELPAAMGIRG